jgi:4-amino-4-deoxy-L-arabinose transferase-like glycosyltransferase
LVLLAGLSFVGGLGRGAIADSDEAFYAESAREMVESGDWLTPAFNYEPRFQKPVLYYWLAAGTYAVAGPNAFSARLWSALSGVGLVLVVAACARRWFDEIIALLAGAITATTFGYFALARMALPDLPLAFFITLTIWAVFVARLERARHPDRWLLLAGAAAALGFLTKGPLAVLVPGLVVVPILLVERRSFNIRLRDVVMAGALFVALSSPWYIAMWVRHGAEYLQGFFVGDNYERFATARFNDPRPWWFYLPVLAGGLLPWTPLTILWVRPVAQFLTRRRDAGTLEVRLILWAALPLLFFTLSIGKQPRYILPVLPPIAILLAASIVERTSEWQSRDGMRTRPRPNRAIVAGCAVGGLVLVVLAGTLYRARLLFLNVSDRTTIAVASVAFVVGAVVVGLSLTRAWRAAPAALAAATAIAFAVVPYGVLSSPSDATVHQMAALVRNARTGGEAIGTYKVFVRNLVFYTGVKHTDLIHEEHIADWLSKNPQALVVMPSAEAARLEQLPWLSLQRVATLPYFDDGSLRLGTLLWPDPARDLDTVVLTRLRRK